MFRQQPSTGARDHHLLCELLPQSPWTWKLILKETWHNSWSIYLVTGLPGKTPDMIFPVLYTVLVTALLAQLVKLSLSLFSISILAQVLISDGSSTLLSAEHILHCAPIFCAQSSSTTQALCVCGITAVCCSAQLTTATTGFFSGAPYHNSVDLTLYGNKVFDNGFVRIYSLQILNSFCLFMLCCGALRYSHQNSVSDAKPNRVNRSERSEPYFSGLRRARHFCGLNLFLHEFVFFLSESDQISRWGRATTITCAKSSSTPPRRTTKSVFGKPRRSMRPNKLHRYPSTFKKL